jgi:NADH-quinone oxidoreductase subunit G
VLTGGRLTLEDSYAYAKFARVALGTNDIDMRARQHSAEEEQFLASLVAGHGIGVKYTDLEAAPAVLLAGFEPEDESPIVFLRLRKAARQHGQRVFSIAASGSRGLAKLNGTLLSTVPGEEAAALTAIAAGGTPASEALGAPGAIILAGERLAHVPGALAAVARLAEATGARLAWIPRRAGERGAIEAGALPGLLPVGRPVTDATARAEVARAWGVRSVPDQPGRDTTAILAAAASGELGGLVIAGVDPADLPDPASALSALDRTPFIVSLELRASAVTDRADVVFPVAAVAEKAGTFVNWEGRGGTFEAALRVPGVRTDLYVLGAIADEMDVHLGLPDPAAARAEIGALGTWRGARPEAPQRGADGRAELGGSGGDRSPRLATWHQLLDNGRMQDGEPYLAGTAREPVARMSEATATAAGVVDGDKVTVATAAGTYTLPVEVTPVAEGTVWIPGTSAAHGSIVTLRRGQ